jgi:hypothetical protein
MKYDVSARGYPRRAQAGSDIDASNNTTGLVIDAYDKNDF